MSGEVTSAGTKTYGDKRSLAVTNLVIQYSFPTKRGGRDGAWSPIRATWQVGVQSPTHNGVTLWPPLSPLKPIRIFNGDWKMVCSPQFAFTQP